jgi:hypothetical protein
MYRSTDSSRGDKVSIDVLDALVLSASQSQIIQLQKSDLARNIGWRLCDDLISRSSQQSYPLSMKKACEVFSSSVLNSCLGDIADLSVDSNRVTITIRRESDRLQNRMTEELLIFRALMLEGFLKCLRIEGQVVSESSESNSSLHII